MASRRAGPRDLPLLGERLEALRRDWSARRLDSDPLAFAHGFTDPGDREVAAFLAASLAFGRVASIQASVARVLEAMGPRPAVFLEEWDEKGIPALRAFRHRWVSGKDVEDLLRMVKRARRAHGSLGALFAAGDAAGEKTGDFLAGEEGQQRRMGADGADYVSALSTFLRNLHLLAPSHKTSSRGLKFLLPSPGGGSACKRQHLFLRWMVRTEGFDLGLWTGGRFTPARLLLPMDTHVHRIAIYLGLTRRKSADLAAAREATGWLRALNPGDPVAYDWALSRLGILAECVTERTRRHCERCAVRPVCRASLIPSQGVAAA
jgi:uncharacterized protein (TIGR02757 family)